MLDSDPVPPDVVQNIRLPLITIGVKLVDKVSGREISAHTLLDSSAKGLVIHEDYAKKNNLTLRTLAKPIPAQNVDGSENTNGVIHHTTIQHLKLEDTLGQTHEECAKFYITTIGDYNLILGTDWLWFHNPKVNWAKDEFTLTCCPATCQVSRGYPLLHLVKANEKSPLQVRNAGDVVVVCHVELTPDHEEPDYGLEGAAIFLSTKEKINALCAYHFDVPVWAVFLKYQVQIAKTTTATQLAIKDSPKKTLEKLIPAKFMKYQKVFDETSAQ